MNKLKVNTIIVFTAITLLTITITAPTTDMFGKQYKSSMDFTCCIGDQVFLHHYYSEYVFGIHIKNGYTSELVSVSTTGGCNIKCETDTK